MWKHYQARCVTCQLKLNYLKWRPSRPASASSSVALWWISRWVSVLKIQIAEHLPRTQRKTSKETSNLHSPTPTPLLIFDRRPPPLVQIFFLSQPSTAIKIKDGGHSFRWEKKNYLARKYWALARQYYAKLTSMLQTRKCSLPQNAVIQSF